MISALALGPLPELVQSELGDRALDRVFRASGLSSDLLFDRNGFIVTFQGGLVTFDDYEGLVALADFDPAYLDQSRPLLP